MKTLGKYELLEEIATGGMGKICRARDRVLHREVAIKTIFTGQTDPQIRQRFYREARACGALSHPNIITVFDLGEQQGVSYIAMELLEGEDLRRFIDRRGAMSLEAKIGFMCEICDGLAHAHENGILHRDIKPGNIFLTKSGRPKILDFGIARIAASHLTLPGTAPGTPRYMAPEQYLGKECDALSDLFSTALVFFEFLTYVHPFDVPESLMQSSGENSSGASITAKRSSPDVTRRVVTDDPLALRSVNPALPPRLERILSRALSKDPQARYQTARELAGELKKVTIDLVRECSRLWNEVLDSRTRILELKSKLGDYIGTSWAQAVLKEGNADLASAEKIEPEASATIVSNLHYLDLTAQFEEIKRIESLLAQLSDDAAKARRDVEDAGILLQKGDCESAARMVRPLAQRFPDRPEIASLMREIALKSSATALEKALSENNLVDAIELLRDIEEAGSEKPEEAALIEYLRSQVREALAAKNLLCENVQATLRQLQDASAGYDIQRIETLISSVGELAGELERGYAVAGIPGEIEALLSLCESAQTEAKLRIARLKIRSALDQGDLNAIRQLLQGIKELCELDSRYESYLTGAQGEVVESILGVPYVHPGAKTVEEEPSQVRPVHGAEMPEESQQVREAITAGSADVVLNHTEGSAIQADENTEVRPSEKMELAGLQRLLRIFRLPAKRRAERSEGLKNDAE